MHVKYSIIIPHKNSADLLSQCLSTIPQSTELQIIVIDDNSNVENLEKLNDIKLGYPDICWIFDKSGKGAGHARNLGLKEAKGEWLIFIDADDELLNSALDVWNNSTHQHEDCDIIYYNVETNSNDQGDRVNIKKRTISSLADSKDRLEDYLKFEFTEPWGKLIKHSFIRKNNVTFQESLVANDYMFSIKGGYYAQQIAYWPISFYKAISRSTSLSNTALDEKKLISRLEVFLTGERFLISHNIKRTPFSNLVAFIVTKHIGKISCIKAVCRDYNLSFAKVVINSLFTRILGVNNRAVENK